MQINIIVLDLGSSEETQTKDEIFLIMGYFVIKKNKRKYIYIDKIYD